MGKSNKTKNYNKLLLIYILTVSLFIIVSLFVNYYAFANNLFENTYRIDNKSEKDIKSLVATVNTRITLPSDEIPKVETVAGNLVLVFVKAKKAVIYNPSTNRVIEVKKAGTFHQGGCGYYNCYPL